MGSIDTNQVGLDTNQASLDTILGEQLSSIEKPIGKVIKYLVDKQAGDIARGIDVRYVKILKQCIMPNKREYILKSIGLTNQRRNYNEYMKPLLDSGWLRMAIPDKPTSPKQQYMTPPD